MFNSLPLVLGVVVAIAAAPATEPLAASEWVPAMGDRIIVDTLANVGYLVHDDGTRLEFKILSGQRRYVRYIGRTYFAATPEGSWTIREVEVKGRSMTFGETGTFLRLYDEEDKENEKTAYGIHSHLTFQKMLSEGNPYRSMGCILVSEEILQLIVKTFEVSDGSMNVTTSYGNAQLPESAEARLHQRPSWLGM